MEPRLSSAAVIYKLSICKAYHRKEKLCCLGKFETHCSSLLHLFLQRKFQDSRYLVKVTVVRGPGTFHLFIGDVHSVPLTLRLWGHLTAGSRVRQPLRSFRQKLQVTRCARYLTFIFQLGYVSPLDLRTSRRLVSWPNLQTHCLTEYL